MVVLGRKYGVTEWLRDAYQAICARPETLTDEEGERLGMKEVLNIMKVWAAIRRDPVLVGMESQYRAIDEIFGLSVPVPNSPSAPWPESVPRPSPTLSLIDIPNEESFPNNSGIASPSALNTSSPLLPID